jgi:hypothetical protein
MPFTSNYSHMGHTERIRIPKTLIPFTKNLLEEFNRLYGTHDEEYLYKLQDKIIQGLQSIE